MRFVITPFKQALARQKCTLNGLAGGDCYSMSSAVILDSTVVKVEAVAPIRDPTTELPLSGILVSKRQLMACATTIKADLEPLSGRPVLGHVRWRKVWAKFSSELAHDRRAWGALFSDVVNSIGDAGSTRPGLMPTQAQGVRFNMHARRCGTSCNKISTKLAWRLYRIL